MNQLPRLVDSPFQYPWSHPLSHPPLSPAWPQKFLEVSRPRSFHSQHDVAMISLKGRSAYSSLPITTEAKSNPNMAYQAFNMWWGSCLAHGPFVSQILGVTPPHPHKHTQAGLLSTPHSPATQNFSSSQRSHVSSCLWPGECASSEWCTEGASSEWCMECASSEWWPPTKLGSRYSHLVLSPLLELGCTCDLLFLKKESAEPTSHSLRLKKAWKLLLLCS